ncbi:DUF6215 domain-containing protein [Streptomyces longispororuber]|uniref:DUF6215 domain-containing protein n=1 Tax=Streptomyces longispororuber TaxID=68230 RepID=UPI00210DEBA9|nr:DUF6215 domain-containing protein [Streptomyces longispororuber]MCQ4212239.1 DUF6215 domain-containing protein [Streptomyces longispororuber]
MADSNDVPEKGMNPWGQAISAVALVGALAVGFWAISKNQTDTGAGAEAKPAVCSGGEAEKGDKAAGRAYGAQLCTALNRSDLAELLGTPGETAKSASGGGGSIGTGSSKIPHPSSRVEFDTYTVTLSATYNKLTVATTAELLADEVQPQKVLGRNAALYSDRTISIGFRLDGSDATSAPGVPARVLVVPLHDKDSGGFYELTLWRSDGGVPDDTTLIQVAERVLPTIPGWKDRARA